MRAKPVIARPYSIQVSFEEEVQCPAQRGVARKHALLLRKSLDEYLAEVVHVHAQHPKPFEGDVVVVLPRQFIERLGSMAVRTEGEIVAPVVRKAQAKAGCGTGGRQPGQKVRFVKCLHMAQGAVLE